MTKAATVKGRARAGTRNNGMEPDTKLKRDNAELRKELEDTEFNFRWCYDKAQNARQIQQNMVKLLRNVAAMIEGTIPDHLPQPRSTRHRLDDEVPF